MRRFLVAALAVSALALAACGTETAGDSAAQPTATVDTAAATATACTQAMAVSKTGATAFEEGVNNLLKVALEGDDTKADAAEKEIPTARL